MNIQSPQYHIRVGCQLGPGIAALFPEFTIEQDAAGALLCGALPDQAALAAFVYLIVFGALVAFSAYGFLLAHARPALATSYAYVNPVVAVALGVGLAGEQIGAVGLAAMAVILAAVALALTARLGQSSAALAG